MHSRQQHRELARALLKHPVVAAVDLVPTADGPVTEICIRSRADCVPDRVLATIADAGFGLRNVSPQGEPPHYIVEAI